MRGSHRLVLEGFSNFSDSVRTPGIWRCGCSGLGKGTAEPGCDPGRCGSDIFWNENVSFGICHPSGTIKASL